MLDNCSICALQAVALWCGLRKWPSSKLFCEAAALRGAFHGVATLCRKVWFVALRMLPKLNTNCLQPGRQKHSVSKWPEVIASSVQISMLSSSRDVAVLIIKLIGKTVAGCVRHMS